MARAIGDPRLRLPVREGDAGGRGTGVRGASAGRASGERSDGAEHVAEKARADQAELDARVLAAHEVETARAVEELQARAATARRQADAELVEKHRGRFEVALKKENEAREEDEAADITNARWRP
jgi:hypothetical protein